MIDKRAVADDLTDAFIAYQYRIENPMPSPNETRELMILRYRNDPVFHAKVQSLVNGVMHILQKHI